MKTISAGLARQVIGSPAKPSQAGLTKPSAGRFNPGLLGGPISIFPAAQDSSLYYADVPTDGTKDSLLAYATLHNLPVFQFSDYTTDQALFLFSWMAIPFCVIPEGFLYLDESLAGQNWFFVYRYLLNNFVAPGPGVGPLPGSSGPMTIIMDQSSNMMPFLLPSPFAKPGDLNPPNPNLRLLRGGAVPVDASGLSAVVGAFV